MSDIDNTSSAMEQKGFFSKLMSGDFGLAKIATVLGWGCWKVSAFSLKLLVACKCWRV